MNPTIYEILYEITKNETFSSFPVLLKQGEYEKSGITLIFFDLCIHIKHEYSNTYNVNFTTVDGYSLFKGVNSGHTNYILSSIVGPHQYYEIFKKFLAYRNFPIIVGCLINILKELDGVNIDILSGQLESVNISKEGCLMDIIME